MKRRVAGIVVLFLSISCLQSLQAVICKSCGYYENRVAPFYTCSQCGCLVRNEQQQKNLGHAMKRSLRGVKPSSFDFSSKRSKNKGGAGGIFAGILASLAAFWKKLKGLFSRSSPKEADQ